MRQAAMGAAILAIFWVPAQAEMEVRIDGWDAADLMRPVAQRAPTGERAAANVSPPQSAEWRAPDSIGGTRSQRPRRSDYGKSFRYNPKTELRTIWREQTSLNYLRGFDTIKAFQPQRTYRPTIQYRPETRMRKGYGLSR